MFEKKPIPLIMLLIAYIMLSLFGFLSGMFSEGLIGSTHPMADLLADAMMWLRLAISVSAVACPVAAMRMKKQPLWRGALLALPFILLAVQMVLCVAVDML